MKQTEVATGGALQKRKMFLRISQNPQEAHASEFLLWASGLQLYQKETPTQVNFANLR